MIRKALLALLWLVIGVAVAVALLIDFFGFYDLLR
jgi:hypothetical protein